MEPKMRKQYFIALAIISCMFSFTACGKGNQPETPSIQKESAIQTNTLNNNENNLDNKEHNLNNNDNSLNNNKNSLNTNESILKELPLNITDFFPNPHDFFPILVQEADLNQDGILEKINLTDLGYNGGDGGYHLQVFQEQDKEENELPLPNSYQKETGFPFYVKWDGEQMEVYGDENLLATLTFDQLHDLYQEKEMLDALENAKGKAEEMVGDVVSGFVIIEQENGSSPILVTKSYLSGLGGHADCIGYGMTELKLDADNTWDVKFYYLPDN